MSRARTALVVIAALVATVIFAAARHGHASARADARRTAIVLSGDAVDRVLLTGVLHSTTALDIAAPLSGDSQLTIRWIAADGATVQAGERVLELDDSPFTGKLDEARKELARNEAQLKIMRHGTEVARASKVFAVRQAEIALEKLQLQASVPADLKKGREVQETQHALHLAENDLRAARADLVAMGAQTAVELRIKELDVEKVRVTVAETEQAIRSLIITAPRDGVIDIAQQGSEGPKYKVGDAVEQGQTVLSEPDLTKPMEVRADLMDVDDGRLDVAMAGACTLDAFPADPIACTVVTIGPVARPKEGHESLRRAFRVTLSLAKSDLARLRPGMGVKVELVRRRVHGLVVPRLAVIDGTAPRVRLATGELRDVAVGACDAQQCVIPSGVAAGDVVVLGGGS